MRRKRRQAYQDHNHRAKQKTARGRLEWSLSIAMAVIVASICIGHLQYSCAPIFYAETEKNVSEYLGKAIEETLKEAEDAGLYQGVLEETRDKEGNLIARTLNGQKADALSGKLCAALEEKVAKLSAKDMAIPLGCFTGIGMLWDLGPKLPVSVRVSGTIQMEIKQNQVEDGGDPGRYQTVLLIRVPVKASISAQ